MARTKQANPIQRTTSSEYVTRQNGTPKRTASFTVVDEAGSTKTNGIAQVAESIAAPSAMEQKEAGIVQLVIAVAGIYGSLYAHTPFLRNEAFKLPNANIYFPQSDMGIPPRAPHHHTSRPTRTDRGLQISRLPQYDPVAFCRLDWRHLSLLQYSA